MKKKTQKKIYFPVINIIIISLNMNIKQKLSLSKTRNVVRHICPPDFDLVTQKSKGVNY